MPSPPALSAPPPNCASVAFVAAAPEREEIAVPVEANTAILAAPLCAARPTKLPAT